MITDSDDPDTVGSLLNTIEIDDGSNVAFIYNASQKAATPTCQVVICSSYELRIHTMITFISKDMRFIYKFVL